MSNPDLSELFEREKQRERDDAIDAEVRHYNAPLTKPKEHDGRMVFDRNDVAKDPPESDPL